MSWDYADLSHKAKQAGGPEQYVKTLENYNYNNGIKEGKTKQAILDWTVVASGYALYILYALYKRLKKSKDAQITEAQADYARKKLIQGIKDVETSEPLTEESLEDVMDGVEDSENSETI